MSDLERKLSRIWGDVLGLESVPVDGDFYALGGDSLAAVTVFAAIAEELGYELPYSLLLELSTVRELAARIGASDALVGSLVTIQDSGSRAPLFAVHDALGGIYFAKNIAAQVGNDQPIYALRPPQGGPVSIETTTFQSLAAYYVRLIRAVWPSGPYRLFGLSYGGFLVLEMALQLQADGHAVDFLSVGDTAAPSLILDSLADIDPRTILLGGDPPASFLRRLWGRCDALIRHRSDADGVPLLPRGHDTILSFVRWRFSREERKRRQDEWQVRAAFAATPEYPIVEALMALLVDYRPAGRFDGSVLLIRTLDDLSTWGLPPTSDRGWSEHVTGTVKCETVPCELHHHLAEKAYMDQLGKIVDRALLMRASPDVSPD